MPKGNYRVKGYSRRGNARGNKKQGVEFGKKSRKEREAFEQFGSLKPHDDNLDSSEEEETSKNSYYKVTESQLDEEREYQTEEEDVDDDKIIFDDEPGEEMDMRKRSYNKLIELLQRDSRNQEFLKRRKFEEEGMEYMMATKADESSLEDMQRDAGDLKSEENNFQIQEEKDSDDELPNDQDVEEDDQDDADEFEIHFGDNGQQGGIGEKVTDVDEKKWKILRSEDPILKLVTKYSLLDESVETGENNENIKGKLLESWKELHACDVNDAIFREELRDQGFTRPKVLILLPFRNSALDLVETLIKLSGAEQQENRRRFFDSYGISPDQEKIDPNKPADFLATFRGNIDDMFRIGIKFTRKSMKLYAKFYNADIIIASPLGLRMIIGNEGDKKRDFDFLSSIELLIIDQADTFLMQNWDHLEHIFNHLNLIPKSSHDCDFSRVKSWYLDERAKYFRQTIIISDYLTPEINTLFNKQMMNIAGKLKIKKEYEGSIVNVIPEVKQIFIRIECPSLSESDDVRFKYFTEKSFIDHLDPIVTEELRSENGTYHDIHSIIF
ncbi:9934_t:CDS:10 [Acaulospora colombiana]|uniref:9934_t:CDS:1 n=1 Tax=Acaulospora colombiana TaxID=27376 RepID=A0ACA9LAX1_9GLOM|nr:9934_t:CDS:10 [Acaulospora colombiana]